MKALAPHDRPREKLERLGAGALGDNELLALVLAGGSRVARRADAGQRAARAMRRPARAHARGGRRPATRARRRAGARRAGAGGRRTRPPHARARSRRTAAPRHAAADRGAAAAAVRGARRWSTSASSCSTPSTACCGCAWSRSDASTARWCIRARCSARPPAAAAAAIVLFHNHPSGDPSPSADDLALTARMVKAGAIMGIDVLDHVILADQRYFSLAESGQLQPRVAARAPAADAHGTRPRVRWEGCEGPVLRLLLGCVGRHGARRPHRRRRAARGGAAGARQPGDRSRRGLDRARRPDRHHAPPSSASRGEDHEARSRRPAATRITRPAATVTIEPGDRGHQEPHAHRTLAEIACLIDGSALERGGQGRVRRRSSVGSARWRRPSTASPLEQVHLHEVGALDSIIDIVGAVHALEYLGADRIVASPLNVGSGTVRAAHGVYPVPAPATLQLLAGAPIYAGPQNARRWRRRPARCSWPATRPRSARCRRCRCAPSATAPVRAIFRTRPTSCAW